MESIQDYQIVSATTPEDLEKEIKDEIINGWIPIGGVAVAIETTEMLVFFQALVKP
jgi:hypothetical protein